MIDAAIEDEYAMGDVNEEPEVYEGEDLTFEPEDMDNPDEDLVDIGGGYLDIKTNFNRPNMTNDDLAAMGQKVVNNKSILQLKGDKYGKLMPKFDNKEAALDYIYREINEVDDGKSGQQEPSEDEGDGGQEDLIAVFKEDDNDKKGWTKDDHEEEEEYQNNFKLEELAEALGYINKKND